MSHKERARIERDIDALRRGEPYMLRRMARAEKRLDKEFRAREEAILDCEHLTAADFAITINARG